MCNGKSVLMEMGIIGLCSAYAEVSLNVELMFLFSVINLLVLIHYNTRCYT